MKRLLRAMWHLGPRLGYRYWKIENQCIKDPSLVKRWAHQCRCEAFRHIAGAYTGDADTEYEILMSWADELEEHYAAYIKQNP